jgi:hypothetical protein
MLGGAFSAMPVDAVALQILGLVSNAVLSEALLEGAERPGRRDTERCVEVAYAIAMEFVAERERRAEVRDLARTIR